MIYFAFVRSHLTYNSEIYGNTYTNHLNRLLIPNNKLLRILKMHHVTLLLSNFMQILIYSLFLNFILIKFWNLFITVFITKTNCHPYFPIILSRIIWSIYITPALESIILNTYSSLGQNSIKFKRSCLWNSLPDKLTSVISAHSVFQNFTEIYNWQVLSSIYKL